jgi:hypothetical protein
VIVQSDLVSLKKFVVSLSRFVRMGLQILENVQILPNNFSQQLTLLSKTNKMLISDQLRKLQKIPTNKVINVKVNRFSSLQKFSALLLQFQRNFFNAFEINVEFSLF